MLYRQHTTQNAAVYDACFFSLASMFYLISDKYKQVSVMMGLACDEETSYQGFAARLAKMLNAGHVDS